MLYAFSKIAFFFIAPAHFCALLLALGAGLAFVPSRARLAGRLLVTGAVGLLVFGFSPVSSVALGILEDRFPPADDVREGRFAGIIMLGGFEDTRISELRRGLALNASGERLSETVRLAHRLPSAKVIFSGGSPMIVRRANSAGDAVAAYLADLGIAKSRVVIEHASRNTWENAVLTRQLLEPDLRTRYLLVTSAWHMPRAIGVFRKASFNVAPWPVDYRTGGRSEWAWPYGKLTKGLINANLATKEVIGLVTYWLLGRTSSLFPEPRPVRPVQGLPKV